MTTKIELTSFSSVSDTETETDNKQIEENKIEVELPLKSKSKESIIIENEKKPNWRLDIGSIFLLFLLYILQGIPLGIMQTIPFLLQQRDVPYKDQAEFSLAWYPFSSKVLYAPIVDAFYWKRLGRRKSWLIPLQYLIAIFLFILSFRIENLLDSKQVTTITIVFFILNFLAASQDISVDGWALTMLKKENVGYAATCNAVGQTLGAVLGYSGFLALQSPEFGNYFRSKPLDIGLVTLPQFLFFWGIIFGLTTTFILIFKKEEKENEMINSQHMDIIASYKNLWKILKIRNIQYLIVFLLTVKIGTAPTEAMGRLKLVSKGVSKEWVAFYSIPLIPIKLLLPIIISKFIVGSKPMGVYVFCIPFNILFSLLFPIFIIYTPTFVNSDNILPSYYYIILFFVFGILIIPGYTMFVSVMAFAAKISDPAIGGTYMTLLNTVANLGGMFSSTFALWIVDYVSININTCNQGIIQFFNAKAGNITNINNETEYSFILQNSTKVSSESIYNNNNILNNCKLIIDGYYVECVGAAIIGFLWLFWGRPTILKLQKKPLLSWKVFK